MNSNHVTVVAYDSDWPHQFEIERARIASLLNGDCEFSLHHIGSTSVPGLAAKPIIDMLLEAPSLDAIDARRDAFVSSGYEAKGEFGITGRRYFRKTNAAGVRTHHLHAFVRGGEDAVRHLAFRDYLRTHLEEMQTYAALKLTLAQKHPHDMEAYMDGKDAFIKLQEQRTTAWLGGMPGS